MTRMASVFFALCTIVLLAFPVFLMAQTTTPSSPQPTLRYDLDTQRLADVFEGTIAKRKFKVVVDHQTAARGSHYKVFVDEIVPESSYFAGNVGDLITQDSNPKNWLGVRFASNALYVDMCEDYDGGCPTSTVTTFRLVQETPSFMALRPVARSRHQGRPEDSNWVSQMPLGASTPPPPAIFVSKNWETNRNEDVTFRGGLRNRVFNLIAHKAPVDHGSDIKAFFYEDDAFSILPVTAGDVGELVTRSSAPKNWISVRFAPDAIFVDMCEQYDRGCPTSMLSTYKIVNVELRRVAEERHSGRPQNANWVAALPTSSPSAGCTAEAALVSRPAAVLSRALSARYPNGVEVRLSYQIDASGKVRSVDVGGMWANDTGLQDQAVAALATSLAKSAKYSPAKRNCRASASNINDDDVDFFPANSGVMGFPRTAGGVDFDELSYTGGPGNCTAAHLTNGEDYYGGREAAEYDAYIQDAFTGKIAGQTTAVVVLRCEYNGHGFDAQAQVFSVSNGRARPLGVIGGGGMNGPDSPLPPWPGGWIHVSYANGKLYADVWDYANKCKKSRDWASSTYTVANGKIKLLNVTPHHRAGLQVQCPS